MSQNLLEEEVGEGNGTGLAMLGIGDVVGRISTDEHVIGHVPRPCSVASIII